MKQTIQFTTFCLSLSMLFTSMAQATNDLVISLPQQTQSITPTEEISAPLQQNQSLPSIMIDVPDELAEPTTEEISVPLQQKDSQSSLTISVPDELAEPTTSPTSEIESIPSSLNKPTQEQTIEKLKSVVAEYVAAWQKEDFETMLQFENWEKGEKLSLIKYIQSFDAKFSIKEWQITKVEPANNNEYEVLVLVSHNLPEKIVALVGNKMVKSTMRQWWRKEGEKFVHLFFIEQERHMQFLPKMDSLTSPPASVLKK